MSRPREFDVEAVLDRAMDTFWQRGYEATSLDDLCKATGLSRSSLYATFGSKRKLLQRTIDRYVERRDPKFIAIIAETRPVQEALAALATHFIDQIVAGPGRRGCFLGNCAAELSRGDRATLDRVRRGLKLTEEIFRAALDAASRRGELEGSADIDATARFLVAGFQGLRLIGKVNPDRVALEDIASAMLRCLGGPTNRGRCGNRADQQIEGEPMQ